MKKLFIGAEAVISQLNEDTLIKDRVKKGYRIKEIDEKLRKFRTNREFKILKKCESLGIFVPKIKNKKDYSFEMEYLKGVVLRDYIPNCKNEELKKIFTKIGKQINLMHKNHIIHGDLTTSNMILFNNEVYFIDFSLGEIKDKIEDKAVDLHLIKQALIAKHNKEWKICFNSIINNYSNKFVIDKLKSVEKRGRKKG